MGRFENLQHARVLPMQGVFADWVEFEDYLPHQVCAGLSIGDADQLESIGSLSPYVPTRRQPLERSS